MYESQLKRLLDRLSLDDLKFGLGEDICGLVEYLTNDLTSQSLINVALQGFGKTILEKRELRAVLLLTLHEKTLLNLGEQLKFKFNDIKTLVETIVELPFKRDNKNLQILNALDLSEYFLPDITVKDEVNYYKLDVENYFYEQLDYQFDIRVKALKYFREIEMARCLIHMPTGSGKTKTAMHIINEYWSTEHKGNGFIIWIAHTSELLKQAESAFVDLWKILGKFETNIIRYWGYYEMPQKLPDSGIFFIGIQKLISAIKNGKDFIDILTHNSRMIIIDEAHKAPAQETFKSLLKLLEYKSEDPNKVLLGLTATPGRTRSFEIGDKYLRNLFDGVKIGIDLELMGNYSIGDKSYTSEIELLQDRQILSKFLREPILFDPRELDLNHDEIQKIQKILKQDEYELPDDILDKIAKNKFRNKLIIDRIINLYNAGHRIILFACNVSHARLIAAALNLNKIQCGLILGTTDKNIRNKIISEFKDLNSELKILINVDVLTTGFDAPNIDCVFIARPIVSVILYSQMIGRGIRGVMMGGTETCKLVEVVDSFNFGNESWAFNFFDNYWV